VANNVFKHDALWSSYFPIHTLGALAQTESGLTQWGNALRVDESDNFGQCDFDADGVNDRFFATGATWWYSSGGSGHWRYLNTSTRRLSELTLGYFDGDRTCDVKVGSMISSGGRGPWRPLVQDILWQNATGQLAVWRMDGGRIVGESYPAIVDSSWRVRGSGDFNGDGQGDVLWQNTAGQVAIWYMSGGSRIGDAYPGAQVPAAWRMQGVGDFDGDGVSDILWRDDSGQLAIWFKGDPGAWLKPPAYPGYGGRPEPVPLDWLVNGVADFDGDGRTDILWRGSDGQVAIWHMAGGVRIGERYAKGATSLAWRIEGTADFDADGRADILWRDTSGQLAIWLGGDETRAVYPSYNNTGAPVDPAWRVQDLGDYNADGRADLLWRRNDGGVAIWFMAGGRVIGDAYARAVDSSWQIRTVLSRSR
jgi:hypothetical protein